MKNSMLHVSVPIHFVHLEEYFILLVETLESYLTYSPSVFDS